MNEQQTGAKTWSELQSENSEVFTPVTGEDLKPLPADYWRNAATYDIPTEIATPLNNSGNYFGKSKHDPSITSFSNFEHLQDVRANNQSNFEKVVNGTVKGAITFGTTLVNGLPGLTMGLLQGVVNTLDDDKNTTFWQGIWDNDVTNAMNYISQKAEEWLPNYYTQYEQEHPLDNLFNANFIGDKFIKNIGFTVAAFYSGKIMSGGLQAIGRGTSKMAAASMKAVKGLRGTALISNDLKKAVTIGETTAQLIGSTISAVNEGSNEALNSSQDYYNYNKALLDDDLNRKLTLAENYKDKYPEDYNEYVNKIVQEYNQKLDALKINSAKVGNATLALNIPILIGSNLFQFGKLYTRGFDTYAKGVRFDKGLKTFVNTTREAAEKSTFGRRLIKGVANSLSEGKEEVLQQLASDYSGLLYSPTDKDFYNLGLYSAEVDPTFNYTTLEWTKAFSQAIMETFSKDSTWEQFIIGSLTGALGMPMFGKANTSQAYLGKNKAVGLAGGLFGELFDKPVIDENIDEQVDALNKRIQDPNFQAYYKSLIRSNKFEAIKEASALVGDKKTFKDAEDAQMISDAILFYETGQMDVYRQFLNETAQLSDKDIEDIINTTTAQHQPVQTNGYYNSYEDPNVYYGPFVDSYGNPLNKDEIKKKVQDKVKRLTEIADEIGQYTEVVESKFGNKVNREQKNELIYSYIRRNSLIYRGNELMAKVRDAVQKSLDNPKWSKYLSKDEKELLSKFSSLADNQSIEDSGIEPKDLDKALLKFAVGLEKIYSKGKDKSRVDEFIGYIRDISKINKDIDGVSSDINTWEQDIDKLRKKQEAEAKKAAEESARNDKKRESKNTETSINESKTEAELYNSLKEKNRSDVIDTLKKSNSPVAKSLLKSIRATDYIRSLASSKLSNSEYGALVTLFSKFLNKDGKFENFSIDNENLFNINNLPTNAQNKEQLLETLKKFVAENMPSNEDLGDTYTQDSTGGPNDNGINMDNGVSEDDGAEDENSTPQNPDDTAPSNNSPQSEVYQEVPKGEEFVTLSDTGLKDSYNDNTDQVVPAVPEGTKHKYIAPATSKYTKESMQQYKSKAPVWTELEKDGKMHPVREYLYKKGVFDFIDNGGLFEHFKKDNTIYFGIDPKLSERDILIFIKEGNEYRVIGNTLLARAKDYEGLEEVIKDVYAEWESSKKLNHGDYFISSRTGKIHSIKRGRIQISDDIRTVADAINNTPKYQAKGDVTEQSAKTKVKSEVGLLIVTDKASTEKTNIPNDRPISKTEGFSQSEIGQVKVTIPNSNGTKSLVTATPRFIRKGDFNPTNVNSNDAITKYILTAYRELINLFKSNIDHNSEEYKTKREGLKKELFKFLSARELGIASNNGNLYFFKINRSKKVKDKNGNESFEQIPNGMVALNDLEIPDANGNVPQGKVNAYDLLESKLYEIGARYRVNVESVTSDTTGVNTMDWLYSDKLNTHAVKLETEASWFDASIDAPTNTNTATETKPGELSQEEQKKEDDKANRRNSRRNRLTMESADKHSTPLVRQNKTKEQLKNEVVERLKQIIPIQTDEAVRIVDSLVYNDNPCEALIDLDEKLILLAENSAEGAEYHEAFHFVSNLLLTEHQRDIIYNEARILFGNLSDDILEERLAEDFREYMNMNILPSEYKGLARLKRWFANLKNKLKFYFTHRNVGAIKQLYNSIKEGDFANSEVVNNKTGSLAMDSYYTFNLNNEEDRIKYKAAVKLYNDFKLRGSMMEFSKLIDAETFAKDAKKQYPFCNFKVIELNRNNKPFKVVMLKPRVYQSTNNGRAIEVEREVKVDEFNQKMINIRNSLIEKARDMGYDDNLLESASMSQLQHFINC